MLHLGGVSNSSNPTAQALAASSVGRGEENLVAKQKILASNTESRKLASSQSGKTSQETVTPRGDNTPLNKNSIPLAQQEIKVHAENASRLQTVLPKSGKNTSKSSDISSDNTKTSMRSETTARGGGRAASIPLSPEKAESHSLNSVIKNLGDQEEIKKLATEFQSLKELFVPSAKEDENNSKWQTITIPFYNGHRVEDHEVKIDRTREHFLRFIFDVNLEDNPMQVDGLIKFEDNNKTPRAFDLTLRSKKHIEHGLQSRIAEIYSLNQNMTGVRGIFAIESFDEYVKT